MKTYNITFSIDKTYTILMLITLYSLLKNNRGVFFNIYICHNSNIEHNYIDGVINKFKIFEEFRACFKVNIVDMSLIKDLNNMKTFHNWTKEIYFKVFLPKVIPIEVENILHLDTDVLVLGNIAFMFDIPNDKLFLGDAVVIDGNYNIDVSLNVGVLSINLKLAREENIIPKMVDYITSNQSMQEEQTINELFYDKATKTNLGKIFTTHRYKKGKFKDIKYEDIAIVHYTASKPYSIEKSRYQYASESVNEYYKYVEFFISDCYKKRFIILRFYVIFIAPLLHPLYRKIITKINKMFSKNIQTRPKFILNKIIKYTKI